MPLRPATVSEMMAPTNASVTPTLSEAKKYGIDRGNPTLRSTSKRDAPSERSTSISSGSTVARPAATLTAIGKNETRNAVSTAGTGPAPNQITNTGTTATFGTLLKPINTGYSPR